MILVLTLFNHIDDVNYREKQEIRENSIIEVIIKNQTVSEVASGVDIMSKKLSAFDIVSINCVE